MGIRPLCASGIERLWKLRIWADIHGQDLIEYALLAAFVALAAGALSPGVAKALV